MTVRSEAVPAAPDIQPPGGLFTSNLTVTILGPSNLVRFTLDGSEPGTNSPIYSAPLRLTNTALLRARVIPAVGKPGTPTAAAFILTETNVTAFSSSLPVIVLNSFGQTLPPVTNASLWMQVFNVDTNRRASVSAPAEYDGPVNVKLRGFTSRRNPKKSYGVETINAAGKEIDVPLLGLPAESDWVLYAPYADKTLLRDVLSYELSQKLGHYASRTRFVEVFINDTAGPLQRAHYAGVYVLEEKVKISPERVALKKLSPKHQSEPDITGGYLFKKDHFEKSISAPVLDAPVRSRPPALGTPVPSGPGGFPAAATGFLPSAEVTVLSLAQSVLTNSILETNLVAGTNRIQPLPIVTVVWTNALISASLVTVTNPVPDTNYVAVTNQVLATNQVVANVPVVRTNPVVASQTVSATNSVATTITTSTSHRTNFLIVTNLIAVTNPVIVTNLVAATNAVPVTNLVASAVAVLSTNVTLTTNVFRLGAPDPAPLFLGMEASGEGFYTSQANAFFYVDPKPEKITPAQKAWLTDYLNRFEAALHGPDFRNPTNGYAAFIDVDSFIDYHLFVEATKNIDAFRFSTYFSKDRGAKLRIEPIWDWNLSMGNSRGKQGYMAEHWYWPQLDDQQYSWYRRLFEDPEFGQRYVDRWAQWRTNIFATSNLTARIDQLAEQLKEPAARNFERWPILGELVYPNYVTGKTYAEEIHMLKSWLTNRLSWMDAQFVPAPVLSQLPDVPLAKVLQFSAPTGQVFVTFDGTDPRQADGTTSAVARVVQAPVTVSNAVKIIARTRNANRWSSPVSARIPAK